MSKIFILFSFTLIYCSCGIGKSKNASKLISERAFTEIYRDSLKKSHPEYTYTITKDLEIHVKLNENDFIHYLNNAYTSYKNEPDSLGPVIGLFLKSASDLYKKEEPIRENKIIPVIKDAAFIDEMAVTLNEGKTNEPVSLVYEKYNDKLVIVYAEDNENGISYFTNDRFKESGLNKNSLFQIGIRNLGNILPEIQMHGENGYYMLTAGGNYESSLILLKEIWTNENLKVKGDILIAIPTRDLLLVTGSKDAETIKKIRMVSKETWEKGPYQLIPDLFRWNGKKFEPFE